ALGLGYEAVFWIALAAAAVAFAVFTLGVREDRDAAADGAAGDAAERPARAPLRWRAVLSLGPACNWVLVIAAGIWMAHVSEAFAILKALDIGLDKSRIPLVFMTMAGCQAVAAYPAGRLSDRWGRARLLAAGVLALALAHGILAFAESAAFVFAAALLWGGHGGLSVGLLAAMVADAAPPALRGTAFGVYHLVAGMAALAAMAAAGAVWDAFGPAAMFAAWAALSIAVLAGVLMASRWGGLPP
ncbi:MAG: MFS transporter, partial [Rhodospirillales bacterium]